MNDKFVRNVVIVAGLVIAGVVGLGVLSTVLTTIVPLTIALVAGFVLGRLSVHFNLLDFIRGRMQAAAEARAAAPEVEIIQAAEQKKSTPVQAEAPAPERLIDAADKPDPAEAAEEQLEKVDFEIKSEAQILDEARRREQEIAQKSANYDARAAIEERRRRLLGKTEE